MLSGLLEVASRPRTAMASDAGRAFVLTGPRLWASNYQGSTITWQAGRPTATPQAAHVGAYLELLLGEKACSSTVRRSGVAMKHVSRHPVHLQSSSGGPPNSLHDSTQALTACEAPQAVSYAHRAAAQARVRSPEWR